MCRVWTVGDRCGACGMSDMCEARGVCVTCVDCVGDGCVEEQERCQASPVLGAMTLSLAAVSSCSKTF